MNLENMPNFKSHLSHSPTLYICSRPGILFLARSPWPGATWYSCSQTLMALCDNKSTRGVEQRVTQSHPGPAPTGQGSETQAARDLAVDLDFLRV